MANEIILAFVAFGAVLLFSGAALSVYSVVFLGLLLGGGSGYLLAPIVGTVLGFQGTMASTPSIVFGAVVGGFFGYMLLSAAVALISFVVGTVFTMVIITPLTSQDWWYLDWNIALLIGLGAAFLGMLFTKWMMIIITSAVGAAFASRSLTPEQFTLARQSMHLEPLFFDVYSPVFVALVILGILSQLGLFQSGYVAKVARILPGSKTWSGRHHEETESTG